MLSDIWCSSMDLRENTDQDRVKRDHIQNVKRNKRMDKLYKTESKEGDCINGYVKLEAYSMYWILLI